MGKCKGRPLFRPNSVRELLINVAKHAGTAEVDLSVSRSIDMLVVVTKDNGRGFDVDKVLNDPDIDIFGLFTIKRRLAHMGGSFEIASAAETGTKATIKVPLERASLLDI